MERADAETGTGTEDGKVRQAWSPPPRSHGFSPAGRPLDYQGGQGWPARIASRSLCAAAIGSVAGVGIGIYKRQPPLRWFTSAGINCAIASCCFCGFQELTRELRAADPDDWANCFLGGLASGALLGRIHGGPSRALPTAIVFATVGTGIQLASLHVAEYRLRHFLTKVDKETEPTSRIATDIVTSVTKTKAWLDFELPEWFPIKKFDEEAAKKRAVERELQRRKRVESLHTGAFPVEDH